ncbi:MAG: hypothetical protein AABX84_00015 [Nanoarchaeota archaeon]
MVVVGDGGESFRENLREIISKSEDQRNSSSYKRGLITGSVTGYSLVLAAGASIFGFVNVLLNR